MMKHLKSVMALVAIVGVMGLLLAVTNKITGPVIEKNQAAAANKALLEVMPEGTGFEPIDLAGKELPKTVVEAYLETAGMGYVFKLDAKGWKPHMILMCGVSNNGTITGATCLSSSETWDYVNTLGPQMKGKTADTLVDVEAGVTSLSVKGYKAAMQDAINAATILSGGEADLRTEDEILADNLAAALPEGDLFHKWFKTEQLDGVDAIYIPDNRTGFVCVIGDRFVGVDADGNTDNPLATKAVRAMRDSMPSEVNTEGTGISDQIQSVQKTTSGNYVIAINANGYAMQKGDGKWVKKTPISIHVSLTPDGTIIDCFTGSHGESKNYGDVCGNESYYSQYDGKTIDTYTQVDAIAGATYTTNGYQEAIRLCFEAVALLEGGAQP